ncbi:hypothetical protein BDB01DRAFT_778250 [Pilobolus umbonatus]|nr:hypothetical protein BDB01DRAFT_778250 [Pilobolus umbonatus]
MLEETGDPILEGAEEAVFVGKLVFDDPAVELSAVSAWESSVFPVGFLFLLMICGACLFLFLLTLNVAQDHPPA